MCEHVIDALVHGSGYERIATAGCSDRTVRRRLQDWAAAGLTQKIHVVVLGAYGRIIVWSWRACRWTGASPRCPVVGTRPARPRWTGANRAEALHSHRGRRRPAGPGLRRGEPARLAIASPTLHDAKAQVDALPRDVTAHLDAAYDNGPTREVLDEFGFDGEISRKGVPAPIQVGQRWVVERCAAAPNATARS